MKTNLASAQAAILRADNVISSSKTFVHSDNPGDDHIALQKMHAATEQQLIALRELHSALQKLVTASGRTK